MSLQTGFSYFLFIFLVFMSASNIGQGCCVNITVAVLVESSSVLDFPFQINRTVGIIEQAIEKAQDILAGTAHLEFIIRQADVPTCTSLLWGALVADVYYGNDIHAIIGPGCSPSVTTISRMAVEWNLPHITYAGTDKSLSNKAQYTMLSRISYTIDYFAKFYMEVFKTFGWKNIANIYDSSEYLPSTVGPSLQDSLVKYKDAKVTALPFKSRESNLQRELLRVLSKAKTLSRVFLVVCHGDVFRQMVLVSRDIGMAAGEYVFIFYYSVPGDPALGDFSWARGDTLDMEAKMAYHSVMVIRPRRPTTQEFLDFEKDVMDRAVELYSYPWPPNAELNVYNIGHYDAFILYAHALNETLMAGENPRDGSNIVKRMRNRDFQGIGGTVYMNANGDSDTDFTLLDCNPLTGDWNVVAEYLGHTHAFEMMTDVAIHWPNNGGPPSDTPVCGFVGEHCKSYTLPLEAIVAIALGAVIIVVVVIGGLMYRRMKFEAEIYSQWWRIKWDDVVIQTKSSFFSSSSKGTQVHIQKPQINSLTVDRKLMMELKQMRDVTCPNLTRLIGLCLDTNNVAIIMEHCARGNLQDILGNESIQLDWEFRISLINDIVQGMTYLHASPIEVHGRLTSSRCVIDSRFVLKITDFGLKSVYESNISTKNLPDIHNTYTINPELLWMAPEILRKYPPRLTSQAGDVYSFGIILFEMCTRNEPYVTETWYQSVEDTLDRIKRGDHSLTRPTLVDENALPGLTLLAKQCWQERPEDRPTFQGIKKTILSLRGRKNQGKNVLDVLLQRMEQYANNLEGLVDERTREFLEEKKKSEELLYQVLPKSVADQLRRGQAVTPEAYEGVTIYFSDIVGFTAISAISTPFQIVDFLNDVYTLFDSIIDSFDVYKVETIGDAYMVASGLPVRNGDEHVRQIARMSLTILEKVQQFTIRHMPETPLKARIGLHSGPVCAGVVGRKMPRYCLFGDTVNTASRMESNGEAMKIHISDSVKCLLDMFGNFVTEERGTIKVKGKGLMTTHWLIDEQRESWLN